MKAHERVERRFPRSTTSLDAVVAFVDAFAVASHVGRNTTFDLQLAIEEIFVNMVKYHPEGSEDILLRLERDGTWVRAILEDHGVSRWDVTRGPEVDVTAPAERRRRGGLGLYLVRKVTDDFRYEYRDHNSIVTLTKRVDD